MMNMIELQDKLKNFSQDQLVSMMQQPTGEAPQFMVLSEITRRQKMQQEATKAPTQSVAQEAVAAAGVPQGGIADMARSLAPQTNVVQNTGVNPAAPPQGMPMPSAPQGPAPMAAAPQGIARMASGGVIKMQAAGKIDFARYRELARRLVSDKRGGTLTDSFSPEERKELDQIKGTAAFREAFDLEMRAAQTAEYKLANSGSLSDINPALPRVESSAPTPVFDATVEVPTAPQMPVPPKTDSVFQGPRPSGTQVNIAGNIYAVLDDGSVVDQMGRTPPPPVAELARQKAGTPAAQFTTQQQYQNAQNLANRIGANSGENAVLPSENLLMGGGREGTPFLNPAPAADTAIYAGGYDPKTNVPVAPSGLAALSPDTMPTVDGPFAYPESRFLTNLGPRAMLDWEEGQAEEAALIDARTNADLGSGRTPRYDTAIGPQPAPPPAPPPPPPAAALLAPSLEEVMDQFGVNRADAQAIIDRTYTPRINGEGSPFAVNENAPTGTRDAYSMIFGPLPYPYFNSELTATEKRDIYEKEKARREKETAAFAAAETPPSVPLEKSALAAELTDAMKPKPRPKDLFVPTTGNALNGATTGATTGATGSGSGGMSDYETELIKIMKSREKAAESDKWLALAQVGMGLMQGGSGSFLGDVGAAGMKGLETLRTSRDQTDTDKLSLLKAREDARIDRARIAASAAKGSAYDVNDYVKLLADLATQKQTIIADLSTTSAEKELAIKDITNEEARIRALMFGRASPTPKPQTFDATKPPGIIRQGIDAVRGFVTG
jgi:hypothetical protein